MKLSNFLWIEGFDNIYDVFLSEYDDFGMSCDLK
jgi:hypothetical protein